MANRGPNTNGSQFFIALRACPHLNGKCYVRFTLSGHKCAGFTRARTTPGKHVVFGKVIRGFDDVVRKITQVSTDEKDRPVVPVIVYNCGELELRKKATPPRTCYFILFFLFWKCDGQPLIAHHVLSFQRKSPR
jgi:peptidyl-prolyl isomerase G (cyclophilin G)